MQPNLKLQAVIDTNVWLSGFIFGGNPEKAIRQFIDGRLIVITAEDLLSELRRKVTQRFPLYEPRLVLLEASIREDAILVQLGSVQISASRDTDDNKFIEIAVVGSAQYIVSGDKDLLTLGEYEGIKILKPSEFLELSQ